MPVVKIRTNRQVTIPKQVFDELGLQEGDYVEVTRTDDMVVIKQKKLVDPDDILSPAEEKIVRDGFEQLKRDDAVSWDQVKHDLDL